MAIPDIQRVFTCFSDLPTELRHKIWKYALNKKRLVDVKQQSKGCGQSYSSTKPPSMLHVNVEAREIALEKYSCLFERNLFSMPFYFDLSSDTLEFQSNQSILAFEAALEIQSHRGSGVLYEIGHLINTIVVGNDVHSVAAGSLATALPYLRRVLLRGGTRFLNMKVESWKEAYRLLERQRACKRAPAFELATIGVLRELFSN